MDEIDIIEESFEEEKFSVIQSYGEDLTAKKYIIMLPMTFI